MLRCYDAETHKCLRVYGDYPDEKAQEQAAAFALEHDTAQQNTAELPAFLDMHLIEANLLDDGGRKHKRQEIFEYFQAHKNLAERTEFLKNSYNDIWVEVLTDGVRSGYHAEKDGLKMWEGSYLSRTSESVFSWSVITEMTEGLIERGEYKIKLGLQNAPVMAEQLALFDMGGDAPVYEAPADAPSGILAPARTVPQEVIDLALCTGGNEPNSAERIAVFYMRERPEQENEEFLRREFGTENGRGIEYEGRKYAVWFMEDGVHLAQGDSVRTGYSKTMVTWEQASARILELLEAGTYLSAAELAQAPDKVLHEAMDALLMTARDLNEEGRAQGLFPQTLAIHDQHKGYPELDEDMVAFAKTDGGLQMLAQEYHAFLYAYPPMTDELALLRRIGDMSGVSLRLTARQVTPAEEDAILHAAANKSRMERSNVNDLKQSVTAEAKLRDVVGLVESQRQEQEPLIHCAVYLDIAADSPEKLRAAREVTARMMFANSEFLLMLNQATTDREQLARLLGASDTQMSYVDNAPAGHGLIKVGGAIVPFANELPKNTELYRLMSTRPGED